MIHLLYGEDIKKKDIALAKLIRTGAEMVAISKKEFDEEQFQNFCSGAGLFAPSLLISLSAVLEDEDTRSFILKKLPSMADSVNDFIFNESKLNKSIIDSFKKAGAVIDSFEIAKEKKDRFNSFMLANSLGVRDRLGLWIGFRQAMASDVALEELAGVLFWKAKDMILKKNLAKFSEPELISLTSQLSYLLPQARKQGEDDELAFERFLLEAF